jgi:transcriptional regulator with XRE-family HTH domain
MATKRARPQNRNRLRVLRAEHRISQMNVARKLGIGPYRFWQLENDYQDPTPEERAALADLFGVGEAEIFPSRDESTRAVTKPRQRASAAR